MPDGNYSPGLHRSLTCYCMEGFHCRNVVLEPWNNSLRVQLSTVTCFGHSSSNAKNSMTRICDRALIENLENGETKHIVAIIQAFICSPIREANHSYFHVVTLELFDCPF